jgi:hypothetical protein
MKYFMILICVLFMGCASVATAEDFNFGGSSSASRNYQDDTGFYVIDFVYNTRYATIPAIEGAKPHYGASIKVYQIVDGKKTLIGKEFGGQYIPGGCFEDASEYLVKKAKEFAKEENK